MTPNGRKAARPFTARSLVGMSQSSRKRKARAVAFVVINSVTFFEHAVPLASALHERLYRERGFPRHSEEMMRVRDVRSKYRIGERLRQCPGCPECEHGKCWRCDNCGTTKGLCDLTLAEVRCKCGKGCGLWRISYPATTVCHGSGVVLPARKQG